MVVLAFVGCSRMRQQNASLTRDADAAFARLSEEFLAGYLAWRPETGTALGLHEYDGKLTDYSRASIEAELARLKGFDQRLGGLNTELLSPRR